MQISRIIWIKMVRYYQKNIKKGLRTNKNQKMNNNNRNKIPLSLMNGVNNKAADLVSDEKIKALMKKIDFRLIPSKEVINFINGAIEQYVIESMKEMIKYAIHRSDNTVDFRDAKLFYERSFNKGVPMILGIMQQQNTIKLTLRAIQKKRAATKNHIRRIQDFKKSKK